MLDLTFDISAANVHGMDTESDMTAIEIAVEEAGSQKALGLVCGVTQSAVSQWINGAPIDTRHFPSIVRAANGKVTLQRLLEDEIQKAEARNRVSSASRDQVA